MLRLFFLPKRCLGFHIDGLGAPSAIVDCGTKRFCDQIWSLKFVLMLSWLSCLRGNHQSTRWKSFLFETRASHRSRYWSMSPKTKTEVWRASKLIRKKKRFYWRKTFSVYLRLSITIVANISCFSAVLSSQMLETRKRKKTGEVKKAVKFTLQKTKKVELSSLSSPTRFPARLPLSPRGGLYN